MFEMFKKKNKEEALEPQNDFLSNEIAAFNTKSDNHDIFVDSTDYSSLTYQEPIYDVPEYKAQNLSDLGIVVDSTAVGFNKDLINPNVKIIDIPNSEENDNLMNISQNEEPIELLEVSTPEIIAVEPTVENELPNIFKEPVLTHENVSTEMKHNDEPSISIFGSNDGVSNINNYTSNNQINTEPQELISEVEYTSNGYKICPQCGTILNPDAPVCFMCSKSFVKKM